MTFPAPTPAAPDVPCTRCGKPVPNSAALAEVLPDLPPDTPIAVLCPACSAEDPQSPHPSTSGTPSGTTYRVTFTLQETEDPDLEEWTDVGRFQLQGVAPNVAAFVEAHTQEFGRRMQAILDFADAGDSTDGRKVE